MGRMVTEATHPEQPAGGYRGLSTVAVLTLGCKLNQAESEAIARGLTLAGCRVVDRPAAADAFVINSCSVTHVADRKTRHLVRLARRLAPEAVVLLTGCFPETAGMEVARATGADLVVPSRDKDGVVAALLDFRPAAVSVAAGSMPGSLRTRAFVKAQEGCNDVCAFCIVPRTRGRERSLSPEQVATVVAEREEAGAQEVVITGTQLGAYGRDLDGFRYGPEGLIRRLLETTSVPRIRFSSLQPQDMSPRLLALWEDPRLCRHFHLALQSGSEAVLRRMRRRYTIARYREALALIREIVPKAAITTDVIAGFPGESEVEFAETIAFCREAGFAQMHVFPYSRRPGTSAYLLKEHVPDPIKRERVSALIDLARASGATYRRQFIGRVEPVLFESVTRDANGLRWEGLTDTYIRVVAPANADLQNRILPVALTADSENGLTGTLAGSLPSLPAARSNYIPLVSLERP